jgi:hypothetical protein
MVDFTFVGGSFSTGTVLITPITDKAREHFRVGDAVHSWYIPKSGLNAVLNEADAAGVTFEDVTDFKIMKHKDQ